MNTLNFETGIVTFSVNDRAEVSFNPTDSYFGYRLFETFEKLDEKQKRYKEELSKLAKNAEIFDLGRRMDKEMREMIDSVFEEPVCDAVFGNMNVYAMGGGLPVWSNFILAVIEEIDTTFAREQKATNPKIAKYMAKYQKK